MALQRDAAGSLYARPAETAERVVQAARLSGIGITMLGGILVSALMTFFVVPAAFYLFERGRQTKAEPQPGPAPRKGAEGRVLGAD